MGQLASKIAAQSCPFLLPFFVLFSDTKKVARTFLVEIICWTSHSYPRDRDAHTCPISAFGEIRELTQFPTVRPTQ